MAKLPMIEESNVTTRPAPTEYANPNASPNAFGAGLGEAVAGLGRTIDQIQQEARATAANFASADAELKFGAHADSIVEEYKKELLAKASSPGDYAAIASDLHVKFSRKMEEARAGFGATLQDPMARNAFTVRTKLQTQAASRGMLEHGDQSVSVWRRQTAEGMAARGIKLSGNVTGDVAADLANLQIQMVTSTKTIQEALRADGMAQPAIDKETAKIEVAAVEAALAGYGSNYEAAMAFLGSKLPGTNVSVGFNPNQPVNVPMTAEDSSILSGDDTQKWVKHFEGHKSEKVGADLGELWWQRRNEKGFSMEKAAAEAFKAGVSGADVGKARSHYQSALTAAETRRNIADGNNYKAAYDIVSTKYDGNVDAAIKAKDERFLRLWAALGPNQGNLRNALRREEVLDPAAYGALMPVIDMSATPGRLAATYPTAEAFMAAVQGPSKHLWPQALELYKRDVGRDTTQDANYQTFRREVEIRAKSAFGFEADWMKDWAQTSEEQQNAYFWYMAAVGQMWADHQTARKATAPGARDSDVNWYSDGVNKLTNQAKSMYSKGTFSRSIPAIPGGTARRAPVPAPAPSAPKVRPGKAEGEEVDSGTLGYDPGDTMVWRGNKWVKKGAK